MTSRDRATLAAVAIVALLAAGGYLYLGRTGRISWREHDGVVVNRAVQLSTGKSTVVRYTLTIREGEKEIATFDVPYETYRRTTVGSHVHRDRFGTVRPVP